MMVRKLEVNFSSGIQNKDFTDRKYTLTHCDETGQRYLWIAEDFAKEKYNRLKDEVLGEWLRERNNPELHVMCTLYSEHSRLTIEERYKKFKEHMPRAIAAIINGDREYITKKELLNHAVQVSFLYKDRYAREDYGKVKDYILE